MGGRMFAILVNIGILINAISLGVSTKEGDISLMIVNALGLIALTIIKSEKRSN